MAAKKKVKEVTMEEALWKSADKLRGSVEPSEYKHVVLSLFFLKFASDKFEEQRSKLKEQGMEKFIDNIAFYTKDNVFTCRNRADGHILWIMQSRMMLL